MSRKTEASTPKIDRRVRRMRDALGDALLTLMQEKAFETITVQQVLDRAALVAPRFTRTTVTRTTYSSATSKTFSNRCRPYSCVTERLRIAWLLCASCFSTSPRCVTCTQC